MVDQAVKNSCCHGAVLKNVSSFGKGNVSRQDGGMHLVPQPDQLEEETGLLFGKWNEERCNDASHSIFCVFQPFT